MRPLFKAIEAGDVEEVKRLLGQKSDPNYSKNQRTPAHHCVSEDQPECLALLVAAKAELEACDRQSQTPMHNACHDGRVACVRTLLAAKALYDGGKRSIDNRDMEGLTPLELAQRRQIEDHRCYQIVNMLDEASATRGAAATVPRLRTPPPPTRLAKSLATPRLHHDGSPMTRAEEQEAVMAEVPEPEPEPRPEPAHAFAPPWGWQPHLNPH